MSNRVIVLLGESASDGMEAVQAGSFSREDLDKLENGELVDRDFSTPEAAEAFLDGIRLAIGWNDHFEMTETDKKLYDDAMSGATPVQPDEEEP